MRPERRRSSLRVDAAAVPSLAQRSHRAVYRVTSVHTGLARARYLVRGVAKGRQVAAVGRLAEIVLITGLALVVTLAVASPVPAARSVLAAGLQNDPSHRDSVRAASDPAGNTTAVWLSAGARSSSRVIRTAVRDRGRAWGPITAIGEANADGLRSLAVTRDGSAYLLAETASALVPDADGELVDLVVFARHGGAWSAPEPVAVTDSGPGGSGGVGSSSAQLVVDADGDAVIAFCVQEARSGSSRDSARSTIRSRTRSSSGAWSTTSVLGTRRGTCDALDLSIDLVTNRGGAVALAWEDISVTGDQEAHALWAAVRPARQPWAAAVAVDRARTRSWAMSWAIALDVAGRLRLVASTSTGSLWHAVVTAQGLAVRRSPIQGAHGTDVDLAIDGTGTSVLLWRSAGGFILGWPEGTPIENYVTSTQRPDGSVRGAV